MKACASASFLEPAMGQAAMASAIAPSLGYTKATGKPVSASALARPEPQTASRACPVWNSSVILAGEGS